MTTEVPEVPQHNHMTRDIKAEGVCPGCDYRRDQKRQMPLAGVPLEGDEVVG